MKNEQQLATNAPKPATERLARLTGEGSGCEYPPAISAPGMGGKFDLNGELMIHPGNTFICPIDPRSQFYQSLSDLHDALSSLPQAACMTFLPKPSFHMTIFCGVSGEPLGIDGWPEGQAPELTLEALTDVWQERLNGCENLGGFTVVPSHMNAPYSVHMEPASSADGKNIRDARRHLENITGLARGDIESYPFHVTLAYLSKWLKEDDALELIAVTDRLFDIHMAEVEPIKLGAVEFCRFETMHEFIAV